jgi:hypothetical protein
MGSCNFSREADCKKLSSKVDVKYFWGKNLAFGNITDISKQCMCISTKFTFPLNSKIELLIPFKSKVFSVLSRVSGYEHTNSLYDNMSVEVLNCSQEYLEFVNSFEKRTCKRIPVGLEAELTYQDIWCACFIRNISEYGVNMIMRPEKTAFDFNPSDMLDLSLNIPSGEKLNLNGKIIWTQPVLPNKLSMNVGMEIIDPPAGYMNFLNTLD